MAGKLRFAVGGNGRKSGLAVTNYAGIELRILVLPKLWVRCEEGCKYRFQSQCVSAESPIHIGPSLTIIACEGTVFQIGFANETRHIIEPLTVCFDHIARAAMRRVEGLPTVDEEEEAESTRRSPLISSTHRAPHVSLILDCDSRSPSRLLDLMPQTPWKKPEACLNRDIRYFSDYWKAFQSLWLVSLDQQDMKGFRFEGLGRMSSAAIDALDLRLLLHIAFVSQVSDLVGHVRPGYSRVTKPSQFIRGRMNAISAAMVLAGRKTTVDCTYDEFGLDTPLLRVIVSALEEVCDANQDALSITHDNGAVQEAVWLRRRFEGVPSLPRQAALRVGIGLQSKMSKLDGDWSEALDLACLVLEGRSLSPAPGPRSTALSWGDRYGTKAYVFDISTESCWENLVRRYWHADRPTSMKSWKKLGKAKAPDGQTADKRIIFDAKYKKLDKTPATGDQHQSFVYSHLFKNDWALLVYPASTETGETQPSATPPRSQFSPRNDDGCCLGLIHMAFPRTEDVASRGAWVKFLDARSDVAKDWLSKLQCPVAPGKP